jgi:hypothetical protein
LCMHLALETALLRRRVGEVRNIVPLKIEAKSKYDRHPSISVGFPLFKDELIQSRPKQYILL